MAAFARRTGTQACSVAASLGRRLARVQSRREVRSAGLHPPERVAGAARNLMVGGSVGLLAGLAQEYEDRNRQNALHRLERLDRKFVTTTAAPAAPIPTLREQKFGGGQIGCCLSCVGRRLAGRWPCRRKGGKIGGQAARRLEPTPLQLLPTGPAFGRRRVSNKRTSPQGGNHPSALVYCQGLPASRWVVIYRQSCRLAAARPFRYGSTILLRMA
jgi:hypothetical protein